MVFSVSISEKITSERRQTAIEATIITLRSLMANKHYTGNPYTGMLLTAE